MIRHDASRACGQRVRIQREAQPCSAWRSHSASKGWLVARLFLNHPQSPRLPSSAGPLLRYAARRWTPRRRAARASLSFFHLLPAAIARCLAPATISTSSPASTASPHRLVRLSRRRPNRPARLARAFRSLVHLYAYTDCYQAKFKPAKSIPSSAPPKNIGAYIAARLSSSSAHSTPQSPETCFLLYAKLWQGQAASAQLPIGHRQQPLLRERVVHGIHAAQCVHIQRTRQTLVLRRPRRPHPAHVPQAFQDQPPAREGKHLSFQLPVKGQS